MPCKSYAIDSPEWKTHSYVDSRRNELWSIASSYYALLFDAPDKKGDKLSSKYRDSIMEITLQLEAYLNTSSALLRKVLKEMFAPLTKNRKTPNEFLKQLQSLGSISSMN
jgi:hypothetical protein